MKGEARRGRQREEDESIHNFTIALPGLRPNFTIDYISNRL